MIDREQHPSHEQDAPGQDASREQCPDVVRLFPLPNHAFLPGFPSPYRMFEPRYRALVEDLLKLPEHEQWVAIPRLYRGGAGGEDPPPFAHLCAVGRVLHVHPLPNLQYMVVVGQAHRVVLDEISSEAAYRQARVVDRPRALETAIGDEGRVRPDLDRVLQTVTRLSPSWGEARDTVVKALRAAPTVEDQIDLLGSLFLQKVDERQAFLEAPRLAQRIELVENAVLRGEDSPLLGGWSDENPDAQA